MRIKLLCSECCKCHFRDSNFKIFPGLRHEPPPPLIFRKVSATGTTNIDTDSVTAYVACRLIPLNKEPGVRPIGIGEVPRRIIAKAILKVVGDDVKLAAGTLQTCAGHEAGCEAAIHAMKEIESMDQTEAMLLVDATNAFNILNRKAALHNIGVICPSISTVLNNTCSKPARLFVTGGVEILSLEGTTQ